MRFICLFGTYLALETNPKHVHKCKQITSYTTSFSCIAAFKNTASSSCCRQSAFLWYITTQRYAQKYTKLFSSCHVETWNVFLLICLTRATYSFLHKQFNSSSPQILFTLSFFASTPNIFHITALVTNPDEV